MKKNFKIDRTQQILIKKSYLINRNPEGKQHACIDDSKSVVAVTVDDECFRRKLRYIRLLWLVFVQIVITCLDRKIRHVKMINRDV